MSTSIAQQLHELFNNKLKEGELKRYRFSDGLNPFDTATINQITKNGIYIVFEKGEKFGNIDRIVRVGTHTTDDKLHVRLKQHFVKKDKNASIFRKNIGRAFLNQRKDPYLEIWNLDTSKSKIKKEKQHLVNSVFEQQLEEEITDYMQKNISFTVFEVKTKEERLFWEEKIIATLAQSGIKPSANWLGNNHPDSTISKIGLWNKKGVDSPPLTAEEFEKLKSLI